jgi:protein-S-isoprenylcysteine O-methyltransferase Ste14
VSALQAVTTGLAITAFGSFAWSVRGVFRRVGEAGRGLLVVKLAAVVSAVVEILVLTRHNAVEGIAGVVGCALFTASLSLFYRCVRTNAKRPLSLAYSADTPIHLVTSGPYRVVRHPFYVSYLIAYAAGLVASREPLLLIVVTVMTAIYHHAARVEEAKFTNSSLASAYERYRERTPMFVPIEHTPRAK